MAFHSPGYEEEKPERLQMSIGGLEASEYLLYSKWGFLADVYIFRSPTFSQCLRPQASEAESQVPHVGRT